MYGGLLTTRSNWPSRSGSAVREIAGLQRHPAGGVRRRGGHAGDVALGPLPGQRVGLDRVHLGARHFLGDGQRDRAGPGAEVGDHRLGHVHGGELLDRPAGHDLGLLPGHEHAWPDRELEVAEIGDPGDVLQRLASLHGGRCRPRTAGRSWRRGLGAARYGPPRADGRRSARHRCEETRPRPQLAAQWQGRSRQAASSLLACRRKLVRAAAARKLMITKTIRRMRLLVFVIMESTVSCRRSRRSSRRGPRR